MKKLISIFILIIGFYGCDNPVAVRNYHEEFIDTQKQPQIDPDNPHAFMEAMPNDEIHSRLRSNPSNMPEGLLNSVSKAPVRWTCPKNWLEKSGDGMRLVTFTNHDKTYPVETSIVSLAGQAGGISANVGRWMQQLKMQIPSSEELEKFIHNQQTLQTQSGQHAIFIDFTQQQKKSDAQTPSMIAAIIETEKSRIFIKMTGTKEAVIKNFESFKSLVQSVKTQSAQ